MKKVNKEYNLFLKMFMEETGKDEQHVRQLMSKLKRAENKLHRLYVDDCNLEASADRDEIKNQLKCYVRDLMDKYETIRVSFNPDPRGGSIRLVFKKTEWINTLGSDVTVDW